MWSAIAATVFVSTRAVTFGPHRKPFVELNCATVVLNGSVHIRMILVSNIRHDGGHVFDADTLDYFGGQI